MSTATKKFRLGIVGLGAMGHPHVGYALNIPEVELTALCDNDPARLDKVKQSYYSGQPATGSAPAISLSAQPVFGSSRSPAEFPPTFADVYAMINSGLIDGILISVPHYDHEPIALAAFAKGVHVLVEKPLMVTTQGARTMIAAHDAARKTHPGLVFAAMFMQRTWGHWKKIKELITDGELGRIVRTTWVVTDWFRTGNYYKSGGWRATWRGEGGGVLTNQSPHNLDLLQWFLGMPAKINAFGGLGKYHAIAVEDEVSATLQYADGSVAHFITSTAESPGTNRLEIVGENGKLVYENNTLTFSRNRSSMKTWSDTTTEMYRGPECWTFPVPFSHHGESGHRLVIQRFARNVLFGEPLVAEGKEGIHQVTLTNAMMVSLLQGGVTVTPAQADEFEAHLKRLQAEEAAKEAKAAKK
ncbi:MAG: Gfo/Idh/MocA family oxidoreductase [Spirochaetales bacterium]